MASRPKAARIATQRTYIRRIRRCTHAFAETIWLALRTRRRTSLFYLHPWWLSIPPHGPWHGNPRCIARNASWIRLGQPIECDFRCGIRVRVCLDIRRVHSLDAQYEPDQTRAE